MEAAEPGRLPVPRAFWRAFEDLSVDELYALLRLRCDVFVVEQQCAYLDVDGSDPFARHLLAWLPGRLELAGCLRVFGPDKGRPFARIGRVATAAPIRRTGLGRWMMGEAFAEIERRFGSTPIEISAQTAVERFYADLGFVQASAEFREDGIPHRIMRRNGPV